MLLLGCGWLQVEVGRAKFSALYPGNYENFFVCNYGVGGNVIGQPVYLHPHCDDSSQGRGDKLKNDFSDQEERWRYRQRGKGVSKE